jgi:hypothetical protein
MRAAGGGLRGPAEARGGGAAAAAPGGAFDTGTVVTRARGGTVFSRGVVTMSSLGGDRRCGVCFFGTESVRDGATPLPCARQGADAASKPQAASATALAIGMPSASCPPAPDC